MPETKEDTKNIKTASKSKSDHNPKKTVKRKWLKQITNYPVFVLVVVVLISIVGFKVLRPDQQTTYSGIGPKTGNYELLGGSTENNTTRYTVLIGKISDEELISINDKLYKEKKSSNKSFFIDYFTDKKVAEKYFKTINENKTSNEHKQELIKQYRAVMISSPFMGDRLQLVGSQNKVLKEY